MVANKIYTCTNFNPDWPCDFTTQGDEDSVVEKAVAHIVEEHGFMDSPQLREDVRNSLTDG